MPDLEKARAFYKNVLGAEVGEPVPLPEHGVSVVDDAVPHHDVLARHRAAAPLVVDAGLYHDSIVALLERAVLDKDVARGLDVDSVGVLEIAVSHISRTGPAQRIPHPPCLGPDEWA